jgi:tetratricopeptide (TPR) repeat protein
MRILILSALTIVFLQSGFSQDVMSAEENNYSDDLIRGKLTSTYREFFKWKEYDLALESWWTLFNDYPDVGERLYIDGVTMYRHFIEETPEGLARNAKIDTLMLIYDQRMASFGGEGNILGRKGSDLLRFRSDDMGQVQAAYGMLNKSLDIQGIKSRELVMLNYMASGLKLHQAAVIDNNQVLEDYFLVTGLLDQQEGSSTRRERTRASIDGMIQKEDILSCEGLDLHFGPQFEQNSGNQDLLEKIIDSYSFAGCNESALYTAASEKLYEVDPGSESAHKLAMLFIGKNDLEKAAWYLQMALVDDNLPNEKRAEWLYELSIVNLAKGDHSEAIVFAREAIANRNNYGKAYMAVGDAFIAARKQLGDDFQQRCAYWVAADMYRTAAQMDPNLAEESSQKLAICVAQYPSKEDIFFQDLKVGDNFRVDGCIQENTTVRSRD